MIVVAELTKKIGQSLILDRVSLEVTRGEVAVIIGPSGGGKSTLLRCINALETFQSGRISVENLVLEAEDQTGRTGGSKQLWVQLRRKVGMVFQQFNLFPHLTALGNVMAGPCYALGQPWGEAEPFARELLKRVGLQDKADARPDQLSGGQQQRVAIARCLAVKPAAILFDEPTSALDPRMADEVLGVINDLAKAGQTMMVVTHLMNFARRVAQTVHVMCAGQLVESGSPERVFGEPSHAATRELLRQAHD